jgi:uncharacterized membrane protein YeaQ/YmgE (transglycosylase-associated protein family)
MNIILCTLFGLFVGIVSNAFDSKTSEKNLLTGAMLGALGGGLGGYFILRLAQGNTSDFSYPILFLGIVTAVLFVVMKKTLTLL